MASFLNIDSLLVTREGFKSELGAQPSDLTHFDCHLGMSVWPG